MLEIVFKLIDLDAKLLLFVDLSVDSLILQLKFIVVLGVVLLEERFLLLKLNASLCKLLSQIFHIDSLDTEVARHGQVVFIRSARRGPLRVQLHLDCRQSRLYIVLLSLKSLDLLG